MHNARFVVDHIRQITAKPFDEVRADFEMTQHMIGVALYAPLRVLIYEDDSGKMCIEYDRPSSLFGQFGDTRLDETAASLERKLADLASEAMR